MNNKYLFNLAKILLILTLPLIVLLTSIELAAFNLDYYLLKYDEYNIYYETRISRDDLKDITITLLDYLKDKRDEVIIYKPVNGKTEQIFEEKEIMHLKDVKELFILGKYVRNISFAIFLFTIVYFRKYYKENLIKILRVSVLAPLTIIIFFILIISFDFNKYFTYFHLLFFNNDLWLLNPKTDILIQMYPLEFFISISVRILVYFISIISGLYFFIKKFCIKL